MMPANAEPGAKPKKKYQIIPDPVARLLNRREKQGEGEKGRKPLLSTSCIPAVAGWGWGVGAVSNVRRAYP